MGIHKRDELAMNLVKILLQFLGLLEIDRVEREVAAVVRVVEIEPENVMRDGKRIKPGRNAAHFIAGYVAPPALVEAKREGWYELRAPGQRRESINDRGGRTRENEKVDVPALRDEARPDGLAGCDIDPGLARVAPEDTMAAERGVGEEKRDRPVHGHPVPDLKAVDVRIEKPDRIGVAGGARERQRESVCGQTGEANGRREILNVYRNGCWAVWNRVPVATELDRLEEVWVRSLTTMGLKNSCITAID
jgi:hypothetical protein